MKQRGFIVIVTAFIGSLYAWYFVSGENQYSGFTDWLRSLVTRGTLQINSTVQQVSDSMNVVTGDNTASGTSGTAQAINLIAGFEGFSSKAYPDPPGQTAKWSIGYGHQLTGSDGLTTSSVIDESTAFSLLSSDVQSATNCVYLNAGVSLTPNQQAALISLCYNIGCQAFQGSTLLKLLNQGDYAGAANEFSRWVYAGGQVSSSLVSRRSEEQSLFLS